MTTALDSSTGCPPRYTGVPDLQCLPRWGTSRNPARPTLGPKVGEVARQLGTPLMPWQQYVADVALEIDPDTGLLVYQEVVLTVPRQSGKTTLLLALMVHRALGFGKPHGPRQNILYAAQTRNDSRKKFEDEHVQTLQAARALRKLFRVRMTNGNEAILWKNGSKHGITSTTEKAGHGETLDLGVLDEAFSQIDNRVEQALKPAMVTRDNAQFWVTSTAGKADSLYLLSKVEMGRALVTAGVDRGVAYFEWSADPKADLSSPETWRSCMPALGLTAKEEAVAAFQLSMKPAEFRRAFGNIADTEAPDEWQVIKAEAWLPLVDTASTIVGRPAFAIDTTPDRSYTAIAAAGLNVQGHMHVEVVEHRRGTAWVVARVKELVERHHPIAVVLDAAGPAGSLVAPLEKAGVELLIPSAREAGQACGQFYDAVNEGALRHMDQVMLNVALSGAEKRNLGDMWAWSRRNVSTDISPLVAVTNAAWGHGAAPVTQEILTGSLMV